MKISQLGPGIFDNRVISQVLLGYLPGFLISSNRVIRPFLLLTTKACFFYRPVVTADSNRPMRCGILGGLTQVWMRILCFSYGQNMSFFLALSMKLL